MAYARPIRVAAPARTPLAFGLGSVIAWRPGERWENGVEWTGPTCLPAAGRGGPNCETAVGLPKDFDAHPTNGDANSFVVYGSDHCSIVGSSFEEAQSRATAHLESREEARAEQALWTGDLANTPNFSGANGYTAPTDLGAKDSPQAALAAVEGALASNYGSVGVIHMSRQTAVLLRRWLVANGGRLTTTLGTPVVAGAGYPDGKIIGSPSLFGYRSEIFTSSDRAGDLLDRSNNEMYAIAERSYLIGFEPCGLWLASFTEGAPA